MITIHRKHLERYSHSERSTQDRRKKVAQAIFSYIDTATGHEYRRRFTAPVDTPELDFWSIAPKVIELPN